MGLNGVRQVGERLQTPLGGGLHQARAAEGSSNMEPLFGGNGLALGLLLVLVQRDRPSWKGACLVLAAEKAQPLRPAT